MSSVASAGACIPLIRPALVDFRYVSDALSREAALELLESRATGKTARMDTLLAEVIPAYTTSPGWLRYSDEKLRRLIREAPADGFGHITLKVGEHFVDPCVVEKARYRARATGYSSEMRPESRAEHAFPHGSVWAAEASAAG